MTLSDIDGEFKTLECPAAETLASCETEGDQQMITDRLAPLSTKLAQVKETVETKAVVYKLLAEHITTTTVTEERISNLRERLTDDTLGVDEMEELRSDLCKARGELLELESRHPEMEVLMTEAGVVVMKDRDVDDVVDVSADVEELLYEVEKDDKKLKLCAEMVAMSERLHETDSKLTELSEVYTDDVESLASSLQVLSFIFVNNIGTSISLCMPHLRVLFLQYDMV